MTPQNWLDTLPKKEKKESYVLVYQLHPNKEFQTYSKEFAKRKKYETYKGKPLFFTICSSRASLYFCPPVEEFFCGI